MSIAITRSHVNANWIAFPPTPQNPSTIISHWHLNKISIFKSEGNYWIIYLIWFSTNLALLASTIRWNFVLSVNFHSLLRLLQTTKRALEESIQLYCLVGIWSVIVSNKFRNNWADNRHGWFLAFKDFKNVQKFLFSQLYEFPENGENNTCKLYALLFSLE